MSVVEITTENFDTEVLQADKPVLVDFCPFGFLGALVCSLSYGGSYHRGDCR